MAIKLGLSSKKIKIINPGCNYPIAINNKYREFAKKIPNIMNKNAYLILEIGEKQFMDCKEIFSSSGLNLIKKVKDLQKKDRIIVFSKI